MARERFLKLRGSKWIFMRVVPVQTKDIGDERLDSDRLCCGGALTRGSGVPGEQPIRSFEIRFCLGLRDESLQFESQQGEETDA